MAVKEVKEETFEEVFDKAASEADGTVVTETTEDKKATETHEKQVEVGEKVETGEKPEDKTPKVVQEEDYKQKYSSLQGMFEKLSKDFEDYKKEKVEKEEKVPEKPKETAPEPDVVDEELESYLKEYDYIAKNQDKLTAKRLMKVLTEFREGFKKEINDKYDIPSKKVDALLESKLQEDYDEHLGAIMEAHNDYGKVYQKKDIEVWIETLPRTQKKVLKAILEDGDTDEVIELIGDFKKIKGIVTEPEKEEDKTDTKEKEIKKQEKEDKLKSMETVEGKKGAIGGNIHKAEDYDEAFDEAASKDEKKK